MKNICLCDTTLKRRVAGANPRKEPPWHSLLPAANSSTVWCEPENLKFPVKIRQKPTPISIPRTSCFMAPMASMLITRV